MAVSVVTNGVLTKIEYGITVKTGLVSNHNMENKKERKKCSNNLHKSSFGIAKFSLLYVCKYLGNNML